MPVHPWHLREAARYFQHGGLIAYPTEAVYGLGCDPLNRSAVLRLLRLKRRPLEKGLILIAADLEQLRPFVAIPSPAIMERIQKTWPGPSTWLLPATPDTPPWLTGQHTSLAVRVTAHPLAAALCLACNSPLVSTSANLSGHHPTRTPLGVRRQFGDKIDFLLTGAVGDLKQPTPIRDALSNELIRA
jgi:L-threonylcarbamoyladenylate synthase